MVVSTRLLIALNCDSVSRLIQECLQHPGHVEKHEATAETQREAKQGRRNFPSCYALRLPPLSSLISLLRSLLPVFSPSSFLSISVRNFAKLCGNIYIYMFRVNRFIEIRINVLLFVCARYFSRQNSLQKTEKRISTNIEELCTCVYIGRRSLAKDKFREWGREGEEVRAVHCSVICSIFIIILCR